MQTLFCLQYRVATELPYRLNKVYGAEEKGNSFVISPSLRLSTPDFFLLRFVKQIFLFYAVIFVDF